MAEFWNPAAAGTAVATILNIVGLSSASVPLTIASFAVMLAAFGRIAVIIWSDPGSAKPEVPAAVRRVPGTGPAALRSTAPSCPIM